MLRTAVLSERQKRMLRFMLTFQAQSQYPPTVREIRDACGYASTSAVDYQLRLLETLGYVKRDQERARGAVVLHMPDDDTHLLTLDEANDAKRAIAAACPDLLPLVQVDAEHGGFYVKVMRR